MRRPRKVAAALTTAIFAACLWAGSALAADGDLETLFNGTGKLTGTFGSAGLNQVFSEAVQPDGKLVIGGIADGNGVVARLNPDGSFDSSFGGGDGIADFNSGTHSGQETPRAIAIQPDGKIVVVGDVVLASTEPFVVARYDSQGNLDPSFDGTNDPGNGIFRILHGTNDSGAAVAINGSKIDFSGTFDFHGIVYQLNGSDGSLDTSGFGSPNGYLAFDFPSGSGQSYFNGLAIQSDGKIVVVGHPNGNAGFGVARLTTAGALDSAGFNSGGGVPGLIVLPPPAPDVSGEGNSVIIDPSGEILVGGELLGPLDSNFFFPSDPAITAVTSAGALDSGFGSSGYAVLPLAGEFDAGWGIARQPDGKLVLGGIASDPAGGIGHFRFLVARFTSGGSPDTSFASPNGYVAADFNNSDSRSLAFALSPTGVAYVGGGTGTCCPTDEYGVMAFRAFTPPSSTPPEAAPPAATMPPASTTIAPKKKCKKKKHRAAAAKKCKKKRR